MLKQGLDFVLRDKWLFEISEIEIARVDCIFFNFLFFFYFCSSSLLIMTNPNQLCDVL